MIARASRVLPGVLVTIMLAGPAFAASPPDLADGARPAQPLKPPVATARHDKPAARAASRTTRRPASKPAAVHTVAFIDDSFSYTESASGQAGWKQSGMASWYGGSRWQGHMTSSGARYDENALTAAHATLPMGSKVRVKLNNSDRAVVVTITDRPGTRTRIIDLSKGAAKELGILGQGIAMVTLSPL